MELDTKKDKLFLFDVDGTLTESMKLIEPEMLNTLYELKAKPGCVLAIVGGSDYEKIVKQIQHPELFKYIFCENGTVGYEDNKMFHRESIIEFLGEEKMKKFVNYCLTYIANLDIPKKRGTFVELRNGLINVSPLGRNCSVQDRNEFVLYNKEHHIIEEFQSNLIKEFSDFDMIFALGGQTSVDCFPKGWDKRQCLKYLEGCYSEILFFGDRTSEGGNDYEIYHDKRVKGHTVKDPTDTIRLIRGYLDL